MPVLADCHLHSHHSGDSETPMEEQIEAALAAGLTAMCFTEHYDKDFPYAANPEIPLSCYGYFDLNMSAYGKEFLEMKDRFGDRIDLRYGVELGLQPFLNQDYQDFLAAHPEIDYVIGSVHLGARQAPIPIIPVTMRAAVTWMPTGSTLPMPSPACSSATALTATAIWTTWCATARIRTLTTAMQISPISLILCCRSSSKRARLWK